MIKVLYLDGEEELLKAVKVCLERGEDLRVTAVPSIADAEEALAAAPFDIVISGYMDDDGWLRFLGELRKTYAKLPLIVLLRPDDPANEMHDLGASFTIRKSVDRRCMLVEVEDKIRWAIERGRAEQALAESEERLHALTDRSPMAIAIVRDGAFLYANRMYGKLLGFEDAAELIGTPLADRIHPGYVHLMLNRAERQNRGLDVPPTYESVMLRKDGSEVPVLVGITSSMIDGAWHTIAFLTDITTRKQAENALKEREETLKVALGAASLGVWRQNLRTGDIHLDKRARMHTGLHDEVTAYNQWIVHIHPDDRARLEQLIRRATEPGAGDRRYSIEHRTIHDDGSVHWLAVSSKVAFDGDGRTPVMVYGTTEDITERKRAEEELRSSREELDNFFRTSLDMLLISDLEGNFRQFNPEWTATLGYTREELLQHKFFDLIHPDDLESTYRAVNELSRQQEVLAFTNRYRCKDGTYRWIEWRSHPEGDLIYAAARDITSRKHYEEKLRENKEDLDLAQVVSRTGSWRLKTQGNKMKWSDETYRIFGFPQGIPIDFDLGITRVHPDDRPYVVERWNDALMGKPYDIEFRIITGGTIKWVRSKAIMEMVGGELMGSFGTVQDITELKAAQIALQRSEQMLKVVLDQFPGVVYWKDRDLVYMGANRESARIAGFADPSEYVGKTDHDMPWAKTEAEAFQAEDRKVMESGQPRLHVIERQQRAGGEVGWLDTSKVPLRDDAGNIMGVLGTSTDITDRKHAEDALRQANKQLNLLSSITRHDMINQLMALSGYADLLGLSALDPHQAQLLEKMQSSIAVLNSQLEFTRTYQEIGVSAPKWQNLHALVEQGKQNLHLDDLRIEERDTDVWIIADPMLEKVIYNLIENVLRHSGGAKLLQIDATVRDDRLTVVFEDDGRGISEEDKRHLFERGYGKHTGFGLFVSREILAITNMSIRETSPPGRGARFEIEVPQGTMFRFPPRASA